MRIRVLSWDPFSWFPFDTHVYDHTGSLLVDVEFGRRVCLVWIRNRMAYSRGTGAEVKGYTHRSHARAFSRIYSPRPSPPRWNWNDCINVLCGLFCFLHAFDNALNAGLHALAVCESD